MNIKNKLGLVVALLATSSASFAAGPDFSQISAGIDFSTAITAIVGVATALAGMYIAIAGGRAILRMIK